MSRKVFLYRIEDSGDRDCCAYIEPPHFECGHYFGRIILHGACYSGGDFAAYEDIETVLSKEEYSKLQMFNDSIKQLGYGISEGDDRYKHGLELCAEIQPIFDKLHSPEAENFYTEIIKDEQEFIKEEYSLTDEDIEDIYNEYYLDYKDRAIIGYVYEDAEDCGYQEAENLGLFRDEIVERYFDFERFGEDLANDEGYCRLSDGRIVCLNY